MGRDADARVFEKVAADARQVGHDLDAERAQMLRRADPGAQEQGGGMKRAGGDDRLPRIEADGLPSAHRLNALCPPILHEDAGHRGLGMNG